MSWHCWICGKPYGGRFVRVFIKEDFNQKRPHQYKPDIIGFGVAHADCVRMAFEYAQKKRASEYGEDFNFLKDYEKKNI